MDTVIKLISALIKYSKDNNHEEFCEKASFIAWENSVGKHLVQVTVPTRLSRKTLRIAVLDETWKKEIEKFSLSLLFQINKILGEPLVTSFDFYIDSKLVNSKLSQEQKISPKNIEADPTVLEVSKKITDEDLRKQFIRTASSCLAIQETKRQQEIDKEKILPSKK